jgi:hypothetical protein
MRRPVSVTPGMHRVGPGVTDLAAEQPSGVAGGGQSHIHVELQIRA